MISRVLSYGDEYPGEWWALRRDERLLSFDVALTVWNRPPLGDVPDVSEVLAKVEHAVAWCRRSEASEGQRRAGELLAAAMKDLEAAEGLENTALAVVNHHLRRALDQVVEAVEVMPQPTNPSVPGPHLSRPAGQPAAARP
ncbi:hypothetical protein ABZW30_44795 [Kitasatospora sp. NPDC004669]|uniref:hypothetical protein n=1 Tax=Kitasatospora sp. NPDC004669 TaxID=3154555 RepID=UPI0033AB24D1